MALRRQAIRRVLRRPSLSLCLLLLMVAAPAWAVDAQYAKAEYFRGFDRSGDGRVSVDEYVAYLRFGFDSLDADGNGRLDDDELPVSSRRSASRDRAGHERAVRATFARLDHDRSGWLSLDELTSPPR